MASCTWASIMQILLMVFLASPIEQPEEIPETSGSESICLLAYGQIPESIPGWLLQVEDISKLHSENRYDLLAARLLASDLVDGAACPGNGLNNDGSVNACGLALTNERLIHWQNQYDEMILSVSRTNGLPPKVLKALIAVESQFWPEADWLTGEIGLGQMTSQGADLLLRWNPDYYQTASQQAFGKNGCHTPYTNLDISNQSMLQGWILRSIDATCADCLGGINPDKGNQAVQVLAETLNASCLQSAWMIHSITRKEPVDLLSYEDFWRLVLANYHAGAGCLYQAMRKSGQPDSWSEIASHFTSSCDSAAVYIQRIEAQITP